MRKFVKQYVLVALFALGFASVSYAAATKFTNVEVKGTLLVDGNTTLAAPILPFPQTLAQINALTSGTTGQIVVCINCTMTKVCVSSGTVVPGAWTVMQATATAPAVPLHCQ